jgi:hypothetical protein
LAAPANATVAIQRWAWPPAGAQQNSPSGCCSAACRICNRRFSSAPVIVPPAVIGEVTGLPVARGVQDQGAIAGTDDLPRRVGAGAESGEAEHSGGGVPTVGEREADADPRIVRGRAAGQPVHPGKAQVALRERQRGGVGLKVPGWCPPVR